MKTARGTIAVITALALSASALPTAVAAPTTATKNITSVSHRSLSDSEQNEYDTMVHGLKKTVNDANATIAKLKPTAQKLINDYGYDAAFEAVNRLNEAQVTADQISSLVDKAGPTNTPEASKLLREARSLTVPLQQKLDDARYDIDIVAKIKERDSEKKFECPDAIDDGDTAGSTVGSSTAGLFNSTGNRIVYDNDGRPKCSTNVEYFGGKLTKFMGVITTFMTLAMTLYQLSRLAPQPR